jgi:hypothetical protein
MIVGAASLLIWVIQIPPPPVQEDPGLRAERPANRGTSSDPSFYPMPAFASDKNAGVTYGLLGALVFKDDEGRPDLLLTATLAYRSLVGWNGDLNAHAYPTVSSDFEFDGVLAERVESELKLNYKDLRFLDDFDLRVDFHELRSSTDRFFGRAEDAPHRDQSVLTSDWYRLFAAFGPRVSDEVTVQGTVRWKKFRVGRSLIQDLPQMLDRYPTEPGIEGGDVVGGGVRANYDSRDQFPTPTQGSLVGVYAERAVYFAVDGAVPFWVLGAQGTILIPLDDMAGFVSVINVQSQAVVGRSVPFWELSSLGGLSTLRSFNEGRFMEADMVVLNLEERIRLLSVELFGTRGDVQVAPFFDVGKVFDSLDDLVGSEIWKHFHYSYGLGLRGVVPPTFVGRLDLAWGREGMGITIGLDYPF